MTLGLGPYDKRMSLRYAGVCRLCGAELSVGPDAVYERDARTVRCVACPTTRVEPETGMAGASARREYERRKENRERRLRSDHPRLGGLILALSGDPQSTRAWQGGAIGEELMAQHLAELPGTFRVLRDRRIPGTRANIDHIAIGPSGVWVIDAKRYRGNRPELEVTRGIFTPRVESFRVGGRDGSKLVLGVRTQVDVVTSATRWERGCPRARRALLPGGGLAVDRWLVRGARRPGALAVAAHYAPDRNPSQTVRYRRRVGPTRIETSRGITVKAGTQAHPPAPPTKPPGLGTDLRPVSTATMDGPFRPGLAIEKRARAL